MIIDIEVGTHNEFLVLKPESEKDIEELLAVFDRGCSVGHKPKIAYNSNNKIDSVKFALL